MEKLMKSQAKANQSRLESFFKIAGTSQSSMAQSKGKGNNVAKKSIGGKPKTK